MSSWVSLEVAPTHVVVEPVDDALALAVDMVAVRRVVGALVAAFVVSLVALAPLVAAFVVPQAAAAPRQVDNCCTS